MRTTSRDAGQRLRDIALWSSSGISSQAYTIRRDERQPSGGVTAHGAPAPPPGATCHATPIPSTTALVPLYG